MKWPTLFRIQSLPEEQRAEVMKAQITEIETTRRKIAEEREKTRQVQLGKDGYYTVRGLFVALLAITVGAGSFVVYHSIDAWEQVQVKQLAILVPPPPPTPAPAPPPVLPAFNIVVTPVQSDAGSQQAHSE